MIQPELFIELLRNEGVDFFTGIPDSLLKSLCAYITDNVDTKNHIIAANEGGAVALAAGYHLSTGKIGCVYMQNSGEGNAINPLLSLVDKDVYNIPVLLIIGWRGEPGTKDEPQHIKQGKVTLSLLDSMGINYDILDESWQEQTIKALHEIKETNGVYALIVRKGIFDEYKLSAPKNNDFALSREEAIHIVVNQHSDNDIIVSTTGMISRELFEYRTAQNQGHEKDFLTVGSMGHASQIALSIAIQKPEQQVYCFDGDGAVIMHLGGMAIVGQIAPQKFIHIVFNNGAHDSVGGQPTIGLDINLVEIAKACGYKSAFSAQTKDEILLALKEMANVVGPHFLEIKVRKGARPNLGRPTTTPIENKQVFMKNLQ